FFGSRRENAARAVILERACEEVHPVRQQPRSQRVARMPAIAAAVEGEGEGAPALEESPRAQTVGLGAGNAKVGHRIFAPAPAPNARRCGGGAKGGLALLRNWRLIAHASPVLQVGRAGACREAPGKHLGMHLANHLGITGGLRWRSHSRRLHLGVLISES